MDEEKSVTTKVVTVLIIFLVASVFVALSFLFISGLKTTVVDTESKSSETQNELYLTSFSIDKTPVTSYDLYYYNDTYLSCDGTNDYLRITPSSNDTLAFYYKGTTGAWQFVVNVMGTKYTNGTLDDPSAYPVYWNGTDYFFCKTDATTFWEGSIDKISTYDGQLNLTEIQTLYGGTRW